MKAIITLVLCTMLISCNQQKNVDVITTIKPIQMLVVAIAGEHLRSVQLIPDGASPHNYALKPSDINKLHNAQLVFRVDENLESFLNKSLRQLGDTAQVVSLADMEGIQLIPFSPHTGEHKHEEGEHVHSGNNDLHIWLDPKNAIAMSRIIAKKLAEIDPEHKSSYEDKMQQLIAKIEKTDKEIQDKLKPITNKAFMVFHNAWGYFENHYGLTNVTAISLNPTKQLGAARVKEIRQMIKTKKIVCLFSEPQFQLPIIKTLVQASDVKITQLDVLGSHLKLDSESYIKLLNYTANKFISCE